MNSKENECTNEEPTNNPNELNQLESILPFDFNRVALRNKDGSDYYNASWITRQEEKVHYDIVDPFRINHTKK